MIPPFKLLLCAVTLPHVASQARWHLPEASVPGANIWLWLFDGLYGLASEHARAEEATYVL